MLAVIDFLTPAAIFARAATLGAYQSFVSPPSRQAVSTVQPLNFSVSVHALIYSVIYARAAPPYCVQRSSLLARPSALAWICEAQALCSLMSSRPAPENTDPRSH